jgi:hypothetical protein
MDHCNGFHFPEADVPPELMFVLHPVKTIFANRKRGGGGAELQGGCVCCRGESAAVEAGMKAGGVGTRQRRSRASSFN